MLLILISIAVFSITGPLSAIAAEIQIGTPIVGWQGNYKIGKWTPVRIPVVVAESGPIEFSLSASDNDGNRVEYSFTAQSLPPGEQILNGLVRVGRLDSEFGIRIGAQKEIHGQPGKTEWLRKPLTPSTKLILTVGTTAGFDFSNEDKVKGDPRVATITPSELPTNPLALDGVSVLVLAGELQLTAPQSQAIQQWVQAGGRLAVSLQYDLSKARRTLDLFSGWFPIRMSDSPVIVREFGGMELFAGKNVRIPAAAALSIPSIQSDSGEILAATRSDAFLLHAPYGLGTVAVLAMDLSTSPLLEWKALNSFCARLTGISGASEAQDKAVVRSSQLSSTGITDLATQLHAV